MGAGFAPCDVERCGIGPGAGQCAGSVCGAGNCGLEAREREQGPPTGVPVRVP